MCFRHRHFLHVLLVLLAGLSTAIGTTLAHTDILFRIALFIYLAANLQRILAHSPPVSYSELIFCACCVCVFCPTRFDLFTFEFVRVPLTFT